MEREATHWLRHKKGRGFAVGGGGKGEEKEEKASLCP